MKPARVITKRRALSFLFLFAAVSGFGVVSSRLSRVACERQTAEWLAGPFRGAPVVYLSEWPKNSDGMFGTNTVVTYGTPKDELDLESHHPPHLLVRTRQNWLPFTVSVEWQWSTNPLRGEGGVCWYFVLGTRPIWRKCVHEYSM
jgi:hypothetical protein